MSSFLLAVVVSAIGPHEVLLLINENSHDSVVIGEEYARLRRIPGSNVVRLKVSLADKTGFVATHEEFTDQIWAPALATAKVRGIDGHVLAWVYSAGFPVQIPWTPRVSVLGMTFLRNRMVESEQIDKGRYVSPLFAGRESLKSGVNFPQTFDVYSRRLGRDMPLPCMMLGYTGERGNTVEEVVACLRRGLESDGTAPGGDVYFVTGDDVRAKCREWQFPLAVRELGMMKINAVITNNIPMGVANISGMLTGTAQLDTGRGNTYLAGAMVEHLTSAGAIFNSPDQTKITEWIRSGVTATAGAVVEPYALWSKFPDARFFVYYASGCSLIESFYQSVRCPLQILFIGDPLASPWAEQAEAVMEVSASGEDGKFLRVALSVRSDGVSHYGRKVYLVNGLPVGEGKEMELDAGVLGDGEHLVRAVAYRSGVVRSQVFAEKKVIVKGSRFQYQE